MKNIVYALLLFIGICSCSEDHVGQIPTDTVPPLAIQDVKIESIPGGAKITYTIPKETDISYVRGEYLINDKLHVVRSSVYKNYIQVEGLGSAEPFEIKLYTVDHSENLSVPVVEVITPGTPLLELIMESMKINPDFGGLKVTWNNELSSEIGITVLATNDEGVFEEGETLFTAMKDGSYSFRGYDNIKRIFAICLTDKWGNTSDTIKQELTPIYETLLDKSRLKKIVLPLDNNTHYNTSFTFNKMIDGQLNTMWIIAMGSQNNPPLYFTLDLGVEAKLSRFEMWFRDGFEYINWAFREFEVWGTDSYKENMNEDYWSEAWKNDWVMIGDYETLKPSGEGSVTNEDREYAKNGFEFTVPLELKNCRYLRFVMKKNWSGGAELEIGELSIYGNDKL